jgi:hypothetical protein
MTEAQELSDSLPAADISPPLPAWVESLLAGEWRTADSAIGADPPAFEFQSLAALLEEARRAADHLA